MRLIRAMVWASMLLGLTLTPSPARASVWTDNISYDGLLDVVQDNSVSLAILDTGPLGTPDGIVGPGDIIAGTIKWNINITDGNPVEDFAVALFAAQIISDNGAGSSVFSGNPSINFSVGAAPAGTLEALIPTVAAAVGGTFPVGTLAVVLSDVGGTDPTTVPFFGAGGATGLGGLLDGYTADLALGIGTTADYFEADVRDHRTIPAGGGLGVLGPDGVISITDSDGDGWVDEWDDTATPGPGFAILPGTGLTGGESGGFSVLADYTGPGPAAYALLPTTKLDGSTTGFSQFILSQSTTLIQPTQAQVEDGYAFADQSTIALNATIPEPLSLFVWAGLVGLAASAIGRRARNEPLR